MSRNRYPASASCTPMTGYDQKRNNGAVSSPAGPSRPIKRKVIPVRPARNSDTMQAKARLRADEQHGRSQIRESGTSQQRGTSQTRKSASPGPAGSAPVAQPPVPRNDRPVSPQLTDQELLRQFLRPPETDAPEWGIPPPVDEAECSDALRAKVQNFLRLKLERGQHINTSLLSSSAFANPHIYAKLVEFVSIDETATAFPSSGWLTRQNISDLIPTFGPDAMNAVQKAKLEATKRAQEVGKRSAIDFTHGSSRSKRTERDREGGYDSGDRRDANGGRSGGASRGDKRERERDRDRDRGEKRYQDPYGSRDYPASRPGSRR